MQRSRRHLGHILLIVAATLGATAFAAQDAAAPVAEEISIEVIPGTASAILGLAAEAAESMPLRPHVKTRSRLQAQIVETAIAAGEYDFAMSVIPRIANWRKGLAQAAIAADLAERGEAKRARAALADAEAIEVTLNDEFVQGWRRDRVRARIAAAYAHLGEIEKAALIQARLTSSEAGRLAALAARMTGLERIDENTAAFVAICETGDLEQIRSALLGIAEFYGRVDGDEERLARLEQTIRDNWTRIPVEPRIEILEKLAAEDLEARRVEHARALIDEIEVMVRGNRWNPEQTIALMAKVGRHRHAAGQPEKALAILREAASMYDEKRASIVSIWRGRSLRPLAEAFMAAGSQASAVELYERVLVEAVENPNSRPRLEDLVLTCNSIVASGVVAPESLRKALMRTKAALGSPW